VVRDSGEVEEWKSGRAGERDSGKGQSVSGKVGVPCAHIQRHASTLRLPTKHKLVT
jgi:hypothetical protein